MLAGFALAVVLQCEIQSAAAREMDTRGGSERFISQKRDVHKRAADASGPVLDLHQVDDHSRHRADGNAASNPLAAGGSDGQQPNEAEELLETCAIPKQGFRKIKEFEKLPVVYDHAKVLIHERDTTWKVVQDGFQIHGLIASNTLRPAAGGGQTQQRIDRFRFSGCHVVSGGLPANLNV